MIQITIKIISYKTNDDNDEHLPDTLNKKKNTSRCCVVFWSQRDTLAKYKYVKGKHSDAAAVFWVLSRIGREEDVTGLSLLLDKYFGKAWTPQDALAACRRHRRTDT